MKTFITPGIIGIILLNLSSFVQAQPISVVGPGGISGVVLWMKAESETQNWNARYLWRDYSGDSLKLTYYGTPNEYLVEKANFGHSYNFHPSLRLTNPSLSKEIQITGSNLSTSTLMGVFAEHEIGGTKFTQPDYILTLNSAQGKGFIVDKDKIINSTESNRGILDYGSTEGYDLMYHPGQSPEPSLDTYKTRTLRSFTYIRTHKPVTGLWGERRQSHLSLGYTFSPTSIHNTSTYDTSKFNANSIFDAYIPEIFIYGRLLTPLERVKAETYLALKYGFMLERSYISSSDLLMWDIAKNKTYNYRLTGLYRDDKSGLYQRKGTTSYEEAPYYSHLASGSSYDNGDFYSLSNKNKLLVIERFPANDLQDGDYLLWGDNNQNLQTQKSEEFLGIKLMNRRWLAETNKGGILPAPNPNLWTSSPNLIMTREEYKILSLKKAAHDTQDATLASSQPLPGYEGHISFTLTAPLGGILIKFGTQNIPEIKGSHEYGLYINEKGELYPLIQGMLQPGKWAFPRALQNGDRIRIDKTQNYFLISANGYAYPQAGQPFSQIPIALSDQNKPFYVSAGIYQLWKNEITLKDFRAGGFQDTGNRIELSYGTNRATEFANYTNGQTYLLVDRSGTGNFKKEHTDLYLSDEVDPYRNKIIFNHVFFDTDFNGKDLFTFGYRENNLMASIEKENPSCDPLGAPLSDGKIQLSILQGDEGFEYQLINKINGITQRSGAFFGTTLDIPDLPPGEYTLKLKEIGGFNLISSLTAVEAKGASYRSITPTTQGDLFETTLKNTTQVYQMGLAPQPNPAVIAATTLRHGFEINQGKIYIIENSVKSPSPLASIQLNPGDKLQISNTPKGQVQYQVNGVPCHTRTVDVLYYFMIKLNNNTGTAYHVKTTSSPSSNWTYQGATIQNLSESNVENTVILEALCLQLTPTKIELPEDSSHLTAYYKNFSDQSQITLNLKLTQPSPVTMAVFNLSGVLVYTQELTESKKEHLVDISGLPQGIYIVKFLTPEGEFSQKITLNY